MILYNAYVSNCRWSLPEKQQVACLADTLQPEHWQTLTLRVKVQEVSRRGKVFYMKEKFFLIGLIDGSKVGVGHENAPPIFPGKKLSDGAQHEGKFFLPKFPAYVKL